jgi:hypothetical protein
MPTAERIKWLLEHAAQHRADRDNHPNEPDARAFYEMLAVQCEREAKELS